MKILINGYEVKEIFNLECKIKKLKTNKQAYQVAVILLAILLDSTTFSNALTANNFSSLRNDIITLLMDIVNLAIDLLRYVCLGVAVRDIIYVIVNGGTLKDGIHSTFKYVCLFMLGTMCPNFFGVK